MMRLVSFLLLLSLLGLAVGCCAVSPVAPPAPVSSPSLFGLRLGVLCGRAFVSGWGASWGTDASISSFLSSFGVVVRDPRDRPGLVWFPPFSGLSAADVTLRCVPVWARCSAFQLGALSVICSVPARFLPAGASVWLPGR